MMMANSPLLFILISCLAGLLHGAAVVESDTNIQEILREFRQGQEKIATLEAKVQQTEIAMESKLRQVESAMKLKLLRTGRNVETKLRRAETAMQVRLREMETQMETKLRIMESRLREKETEFKDTETRLAAVEHRIRELERGTEEPSADPELEADDTPGDPWESGDTTDDIGDQHVMRNHVGKNLSSKRMLLQGGTSNANNDGHVAFTAYLSRHLTGLGTQQIIPFNIVEINEGNGFDTNMGIFRCPVSGVYVFQSSLLSLHAALIETEIVINNVTKAHMYADGTAPNAHGYDQGSALVTTQCYVGQDVWVRVLADRGHSVYGTGRFTMFSGFLLWETD